MPHLPASRRATRLQVAETTIEYLQHDRDALIESYGTGAVGRLELALEDIGWQRLVAYAHTEFSRTGLERIAVLSRLMWRKNPLIKRAVNVRTYFTWALGVDVTAVDDLLNDVVRTFWDDPGNQQAAFSGDAAEVLDRTLATDGNVVFVLPTSTVTGRVQVRTIPWTELQEPVRNPDDRLNIRYWLRRYHTPDGKVIEQYHPDIDWRPVGVLPPQLNGRPIVWDQPVMVCTVDRLHGETWGVPEVYAALDWARAYKEFLEDWASYVRALAEFAWVHQTGSKKAATAAQATHRTGRLDTRTGEQAPAGATAVGTDVAGLKPVNHSGAHVDADSGRQLAIMVGAAMDIPYALLTGDADTSNLATAKALDRPFELALRSRQRMWAGWFRRMAQHAVDAAVRAPRGGLAGTVTTDEWGRTVVTVAGDVDRTVNVDWPPITEHDLKAYAEAVAKAVEASPDLPADVVMRLLLTAFDVDGADQVVDDAIVAARDAQTRDEAVAAAESVVIEAVRRELQEAS